MLDVEALLSDLPDDDDECIVAIIKRYVEQNTNQLKHTTRSSDDLQLLRVALLEFGAFERVPTLQETFSAKTDATAEANLLSACKVLESQLTESRRQTALNQAKDKIRESVRFKRNTYFGFARLNADERRTIHDYLSHIREVIEKSHIDERKRNALLDRLTELSREIDKSGTKMDGFVAFWVDVGFAFGSTAKAAKPALEELKEILKILYQSRAKEEQASLPSPEEFPRLPSPGEA
jgi:hypothetical protein